MRTRKPSALHVLTAALCAATGTTLAVAIDVQGQAQAASKAAVTAQAQAAAWQAVATANGTKVLPASVLAAVQKASNPAPTTQAAKAKPATTSS